LCIAYGGTLECGGLPPLFNTAEAAQGRFLASTPSIPRSFVKSGGKPPHSKRRPLPFWQAAAAGKGKNLPKRAPAALISPDFAIGTRFAIHMQSHVNM
jgi:hypothetical protein